MCMAGCVSDMWQHVSHYTYNTRPRDGIVLVTYGHLQYVALLLQDASEVFLREKFELNSLKSWIWEHPGLLVTLCEE